MLMVPIMLMLLLFLMLLLSRPQEPLSLPLLNNF